MGSFLDAVRRKAEEEKEKKQPWVYTREQYPIKTSNEQQSTYKRPSVLEEAIRRHAEKERETGANSPNQGSSTATTTTTAPSKNQTTDNDYDRTQTNTQATSTSTSTQGLSIKDLERQLADQEKALETIERELDYANRKGTDEERAAARAKYTQAVAGRNATKAELQKLRDNPQGTSQQQSIVSDEKREAAKTRISAEIDPKIKDYYYWGKHFEDGYQFGDVIDTLIDMSNGGLSNSDNEREKYWLEKYAVDYHDNVNQTAAAFNAKRESGKTISEEMAESLNYIKGLEQTLRSLQPGSREYKQVYEQYTAAVDNYNVLYQEFNGLYTPLVDAIADYEAFAELYGDKVQLNTESDPYHLEIASLDRRIEP